MDARSSRPRWRLPLPSLTASLVVALALAAAQVPAGAARPAPATATTSATAANNPAARGLTAAACGTWVLYQVSSKADLERLAPQIKDALVAARRRRLLRALPVGRRGHHG